MHSLPGAELKSKIHVLYIIRSGSHGRVRFLPFHLQKNYIETLNMWKGQLHDM